MKIIRHGHRRQAWMGLGIDVEFVGHMVIDNYRYL
jgi:hypothetical protein